MCSFYVRKSVRASRTISLVDVIKVEPMIENVPFDAYFLTVQTLGKYIAVSASGLTRR